jgi:hypothetical protein
MAKRPFSMRDGLNAADRASGQRSASEMLDRARRPPLPTAGSNRVDLDKSTTPLVDSDSGRLVDETDRPPVDAERYRKMAVSLRPDQRTWLLSVVRELGMDGVSASDLVRLAVDDLRRSVEDGRDVGDELVERAQADLTRFPGRRNRGLPTSTRAGLDD